MSDDLYGNYVTLLLEMDGSNDSTNIPDTSPIPHAVSVYGDAKLKTATKKYGNSSCYFDGTGDYLSIGVPGSDGFIFWTGAFTIECWVYLTSLPGSNVNYGIASTYAGDGNYNGWYLMINDVSGTDRLTFRYTLGGAGGDGSTNVQTSLSQNMAWSINTWYHLAVSRVGGTVYLFIDGTVYQKTANSRPFTGSNLNLTIGNINGSSYFPGYIQGLRITKGLARYTANFTPSAAALPVPDPFIGPRYISNLIYDISDGGYYRITGTVTELGQVGVYKVRLFDRQSGRCIRETFSDASGAYAFDRIAYRPNGYFAVAYDHGANPLNAAIADLITPEPMP